MSHTQTPALDESRVSGFAGRLKDARERAGLLQRDVGVALKRSAPCIGQWELGKTEPRLKDVVLMSGMYKVSVAWLLGVSTSAENSVPLLTSGQIESWDSTSASRFIQTASEYTRGEAIAWAVETDSMPSVCGRGDLAVVVRNEKLVLSGVYLVKPKAGGPLSLRRAHRDGGFLFAAESATLGPYHEDDIDVIGRVREVIKSTLI